ncbi:MAG: NAD(P)H-dependent oxidoreductase [Comamonadaceae bacterium]|nr:NAD(P)H-dependent oxidoreductase [Comamonadaceae bacterium]
MRDYALPLYDGDLEAAQGVPGNALELKRLFRGARLALLVVSPENNGSVSALLKNTLDWISRPHARRKRDGALPGQGGGAAGGVPGRARRPARPGARAARSCRAWACWCWRSSSPCPAPTRRSTPPAR